MELNTMQQLSIVIFFYRKRINYLLSGSLEEVPNISWSVSYYIKITFSKNTPTRSYIYLPIRAREYTIQVFYKIYR